MIVSGIKHGLILVRHGEVDARYRGVCYGQSDVTLSSTGLDQHQTLLTTLSVVPVTRIMHSGLFRARHLAECLHQQCGAEVTCVPALGERDFGSWELRRWDDIYAAHGDSMMGMIDDPASYRPGGDGESTFELRDRVLRWFSGIPAAGLTVAVTHGGPIAALIGTLEGEPVCNWPKLVPLCGAMLLVPQRDGRGRADGVAVRA